MLDWFLERKRRQQTDRALRDAFRVAVGELGLTEMTTRAASADLHRATGEIHDVEAELSVGGRGWHQVSVQLAANSLPTGISLGPRPRGRGQEDFYAGVAADSGLPRFDEHHAVFGSPDALQEHATRLDRALLDFIVDHLHPSFDLVISTTELRLGTGAPSLPWTDPHSLRWPCDSSELVSKWRHAQRLVGIGRERGLLARPRAT